MTKQLLPDPDLEALIKRLNAAARDAGTEEAAAETGSDPADAGDAARPTPRRSRWRLPAPEEEGIDWLTRLLGGARSSHASDLLLVAGVPPCARVNGKLEPLGEKKLSSQATAMLAAALVPENRRRTLEDEGSADFSISRKGLGRFRCNVHRERDRWGASIRLFPSNAPELKSLHLPPAIAGFGELEHGLVLVTGPTGCGKSTTLAALVRHILGRRRVHLITIEDPVEYEHDHGDSVVEHIEIGRDAVSWSHALRAALRQDPDVLLVGEMRDAESIAIAVTAAETGHLVLSTLHTGDAAQTLHRILDSYPANQQDAVRVQLSVSLSGVVSQQLLPRSDVAGRIPAVEVLVATPAVRNLIRQGKIELIRSQLTLEQSAGMLSLDTSLARLASSGQVDLAEARNRARIPTEFEQRLQDASRQPPTRKKRR